MARSREHRQDPAGSVTQEPDDANEKDVEGTSRQNLCYALVGRPKASRVGVAGWKAHHLGCLHNKQSPRHSTAILVGHDLCIFPKRKLRCVWWSRQHLLNLQPKPSTRWTTKSCSRIIRSLRIPFVLSVYQRPFHPHLLRRHDLYEVGYRIRTESHGIR